ncbi:MAG: class I SAM-dependent methyltransferase [Spirochaetes bacterium]|nr:class I SAM-dependent methyltransferase [Spirochaetota bacterium]
MKSHNDSRQILLVATCEKGRGSGHLSRQLALARDLRKAGRPAWLYLEPADEPTTGNQDFFRSVGLDPQWLLSAEEAAALQPADIDFIVLDRFQTPKEELSRYKKLGAVIGLDEGGQCRDDFDFLIDILIPKNSGYTEANIAAPSLLQLPPKPPMKSRGEGDAVKVLISFGREDTAGLGLATFQSLVAKNSGGLDITFVGAAAGLAISGENARHLENIPDLKNRLGDYDLLVTHYGITAYEALYAGTPVLLVSPTELHEKLARQAGFYSAGLGKSSCEKLAGLLLDGAFLPGLKQSGILLAKKHGLDVEPPQSLAGLLGSFSPAASRACPLCGGSGSAGTGGKLVCRFDERTYRRCPRCSGVYMDRLTPPPVEYEREYFFDFYKKQYGKTYMEDFPNLINMGKRRLAVIKSLLPATAGRALLDIGCAYGAFLQAAREEGFSPAGIDPAQDAVNYVRETLRLPAACGLFPSGRLPEGHERFDVITLWFVIEHFNDCTPVFAEIRKRLLPGGILAFSTPSFSGVSGRFWPRRFLRDSPGDHWTLWSYAQCKKALELCGFRVKKRVISRHHPQRFPVLGKFAKENTPLYWLFLGISKMLALGDTFEVYAEAVPGD